MPHDLEKVVATIAELKRTTPEVIKQTVRDNLLQLVRDDPWLPGQHLRLLSVGAQVD